MSTPRSNLFWVAIVAILVAGYLGHQGGYRAGYQEAIWTIHGVVQADCEWNGHWMICRDTLASALTIY